MRCCCCRLTATDKVYTLDAGTNPITAHSSNMTRATNTAPVLAYPAATNTDSPRLHDSASETEVRVFQALQQLKNAGVNTQRVSTANAGANTDIQTKQLDSQNFDFSISFDSKGVKTDETLRSKQTYDRGINTQQVRTFDKGANTQQVPNQTRGMNTERLMNHTTRGVNTDAERHGARSSEQERTSTSELKTTVQVVKVTECENCRERYTDGMLNAKRQASESQLASDKRSASSQLASDKRSASSQLASDKRSASSHADQLFADATGGSRSELSKVITREIVRKTESKLGTSPRTSTSGSLSLTSHDAASSQAADMGESMTSSESSSVTRGPSVSSSMVTSSSSSVTRGPSLSSSMVTSSSSSSRGSSGMTSSSDATDREWTEGGDGGGTRMKVVRHVETTYVGGHPVNRSSNVEIREPEGEWCDEVHEQGGKQCLMQQYSKWIESLFSEPRCTNSLTWRRQCCYMSMMIYYCLVSR